MKCHVCGKDGVSDDAWIDSQPGDQRSGNPGKWKRLHMCEECWERLDPDMWTCQKHYESLNPVTPYDDLPDRRDNMNRNLNTPSHQREQKLVDIAFQLTLTMQANPGDFQEKTQEEIAAWVADQLKQCGFPTTPVGSSWGVLQ